MAILDPTSLQKTVDNINDQFLTGETILPESGLEAVRWIASRQGLKGSYRGSFAPTPTDFEQGMRFFTGERLVYASARHILGEEASRAVWLLGRQDPEIRAAYDRATGWMRQVPETNPAGTFCCGNCTTAFWRHFWVGDFESKTAFLVKGLQVLKDQRLGGGQWRRFPFFPTVYTLLDLDLEPAHEELRYARPELERNLKSTRSSPYWQRRKIILERALEQGG